MTMTEKFINNFESTTALPVDALSLPLDLPDGLYRLTLTDTGRTRWEIVLATVTAGTAALQRGQEGTAVQAWPVGSVLYQSVTAGQMQYLYSQLAALALRVSALESAGVQGFTNSSGQALVNSTGQFLTGG